MNYEKKYNEALKRARELVAKWTGKNKDFYIEDYSYIFPELRESEDERIRKKCIELIKRVISSGDSQSQESKEILDCIAYLEKQKEQKPISQEDFDTAKHEALWEEQKSIEKQDYSGLNDLERAILRGFLSAGVENVPVTIIKETAKDCLAQIKPAEWNEEEKKFLQVAISCTYDRGYLSVSNWLKFLRPQPHWKKSLATADLENSLCDLQDNYHDGSHEYKVLEEAIEFIRCTEPRPSWKPSEEDKEMKLKVLKYLSTRCSVEQFEEVEEWLNNKLK